MKDLIKTSVHKMIKVHAYFLLRTAYFSYDDYQDITQELCLFYWEKFICGNKSDDDNLIFKALKDEALNMLKKRQRIKRNPLSENSYDQMQEFGFDIQSSTTLEEYEVRLDLKNAISKLNEREQLVCKMILNGDTFDEISKKIKMSKHTIYNILYILKNYLNF